MRSLCLLLLALNLAAQDFTQRGFMDLQFTAYPQTAPGDSGRAVGEAVLRYEPAYKLSPRFRLSASFEARTDSHRQTDRSGGLWWKDRGLQRPAFTVRQLSATYHRGGVTVELGKQFIRWGKSDILNPTDRFAPRDFLNVMDNESLAVTAARVTWEARSSDTIDFVYSPRFTPSRSPLLDQRWAVLPDFLQGVAIRDTGARLPGGPQFGVRWSHIGSGFEHSLTFYEGFNHLPSFDGWIATNPPRVEVVRFYPKMRMAGAGGAIPLRWFTAKGEAAYFTSSTPQAEEYLQYGFQLERQLGEWLLVGGYTGEYVTRAVSGYRFAPDRGLARAFLGRAQYTIDVNRSLAFEGALRRNGDGVSLKFEYTQAIGQHLRATGSFTLIRGAPTDYLGMYRRNSHGVLSLRYSQ